FKGPFALSHAIGGAGVYVVGSAFKAFPLAVFLAGAAVCTAVEYIMAVFLEKCFKVKCWDYSTYPHTKWCHFQGRICLTISAFFGLITLAVVYFYWDFVAGIALLLGTYLWLVDGIFALGFLVDAAFTCTRLLRAKKAGIAVKGWAGNNLRIQPKLRKAGSLIAILIV
ncbi:MAG: putative ABC transporter permease, partial [Spirochaetaceae bacterium]|nr:putative ABC transporter permease [Spirochaetaceae bacterium]